jgi:two-component sensor histidine kinase
VRLRRTGSFGTVGSDVATPLAMVLTEVLQNAMEHGFPDGRSGTIDVAVTSTPAGLEVRISDDGVGLPAGFDLDESSSLGLSIVRTLIGELGGKLRMACRDDGTGTVVELTLPPI